MCSLHVSVSYFGNSPRLSNFFIIVTFLMVICDQWSLMLPSYLFWGATNHTHIRLWTDYRNDTKDLEHYISLADKAVAEFDRTDCNFERHSTVDKMLLSSISCYRKIVCSKPTSLLFSQIATTTLIFSKHHHDQSAAVDTLQWHTS